MKTRREVIGLLPAGGRATRVAPLPCSKELFPVGFHSIGTKRTQRPKVISHYLLEKFKLANINKAYIILRDGKWDIPSYFGDGSMLGIHLAYLVMGVPWGVPYTLDQAYPFIGDSIVALGFPDMIFQPADAFVSLLAKLEESKADLVLGLFPTSKPHKTDMVAFNAKGRVKSITIKPAQSKLLYAWELAVWKPVFTRFMHDSVASKNFRACASNRESHPHKQKELHVGDVIQAALENGLKIDTVIFENGSCLDIGTPEDMVKAIRDEM